MRQFYQINPKQYFCGVCQGQVSNGSGKKHIPVRESAAFRKRNPSAERRFARTNHVVSLNHTRQQKRLNRKNSI